jgi:hypothetical protein
MVATAGDKQCEVILVGCGAPLRGSIVAHVFDNRDNYCSTSQFVRTLAIHKITTDATLARRGKRHELILFRQ